MVLFKPLQNPKLSALYVSGHESTLEQIGINVVSAGSSWVNLEKVLAVLVVCNDVPLGGARLEIRTTEQLPIEQSLTHQQFDWPMFWSDHEKSIVGEICGLWGSSKLNRKGFGAKHLVKALIKHVARLNLDVILSLCASYTTGIAAENGFEQDLQYSNGDSFPYPRADMRAFVMINYLKRMEMQIKQSKT